MNIRIRLIVESGNVVLSDTTVDAPNLEVSYASPVVFVDGDDVHILRGFNLVPDIQTVKRTAVL